MARIHSVVLLLFQAVIISFNSFYLVVLSVCRTIKAADKNNENENDDNNDDDNNNNNSKTGKGKQRNKQTDKQ